VATSPARASAAERYSVPGDRIAIYDLAGAIEVASGSGPVIVVELTRGGRDAGKLRVETGPIGGRSTLRVIYPDAHVVYPRGHWGGSRIRVRSDGTFGGKDLGWGSRQVTVSSGGFGMQAWADLRILVPPGRSVEVRLGVGETMAHDLKGEFLLSSQSGAIHIRGAKGSLIADTGSGAVDASDVEGNLSVDTGSGGVEIANVRGDRVSIDTGSGSVEGHGVQTGDLHVDTGSGHVSLVAVRAPRVHVDTGSGGVMLGLMDDVDDVLVDTGSGGVTLRVPATLGAEVNVDSGSGGIDSAVPLILLHRDHGELRGRIGDGRGRIVIDTGSGGVKLEQG
jgi:DUF4097 and DUF4098 domain-containing protein YvlB